jgi:hypothetical protein
MATKKRPSATAESETAARQSAPATHETQAPVKDVAVAADNHPVVKEQVLPAAPVTAVQHRPVADDQVQTPVEPAQAVTESTPDDNTVAEAATDGQAWLLAQDGAHYTVQLAASLDRAAIERFVDDQPGLPGLYYAHIRQRGRDWYISLYGAYAGLAEARAAVAGLPSAMRKNSPWIRRLARIQEMVPVPPDADSAEDTGNSEKASVSSTSADADADNTAAGDSVDSASPDSSDSTAVPEVPDSAAPDGSDATGATSTSPPPTAAVEPVDADTPEAADPATPPVLE